jgi:hypothetical protein
MRAGWAAHLGHVAVAVQVRIGGQLDCAPVPAVRRAGLAQHDARRQREHRAHAIRACASNELWSRRTLSAPGLLAYLHAWHPGCLVACP